MIKQRQFARRWPEERGAGVAYKQSQFSGGQKGMKAARLLVPSVGVIVRNKANSRQLGRHGHGGCAKQSQFCGRGRMGKYLVEKELWRIEHAGGLGETKPISGGTRDGVNCTNKPNLECPPPRRGALRTNKANFRLATQHGHLARGFQSWAGRPCYGAVRRGDCAKQSQFPGPIR